MRQVSIEDLRHLRSEWKYAPSTAQKRFEYIRTFFAFFFVNGWTGSNPAKALKVGQVRQAPTLPFSEDEWKKITAALEKYGDVHPQTAERNCKKLKALVLLMRYSGLRISDAVGLEKKRVSDDGLLHLYQAKTGHPVSLPLPKEVVDALKECDEGHQSYFAYGVGTLTTAMTH